MRVVIEVIDEETGEIPLTFDVTGVPPGEITLPEMATPSPKAVAQAIAARFE